MPFPNASDSSFRNTRRDFFKMSLGSAGFLLSVPGMSLMKMQEKGPRSPVPWYRRTFRWGQTNINEMDPIRYDIDWWRQHWKTTKTQGLVINAGGIVAYYPSKNELQYRARYLKERDLYGELVRTAHEDGLAVLARMDSNRAHERFYQAHPDWFAIDQNGEPYRAADRYVSCIDSPYYETYLPSVLREIIAWEKPEGFTDNSWSGLNRDQICYCSYSREKFREASGHELPQRKDWDDPVYRAWIQWSYKRRLEVWDLNNRTTKDAGGPDCLWLGMIGGDLVSQGRRFRDIRAICRRSEMVMLDDQARSVEIGFHENSEMGKRLHGVLGWDKIIPESMAMYQRSPTFRKAAASPAEARLWMFSGFAGTIQPWWHHVGAYQWDRRQFKTAGAAYQWYEQNQEFLVRRQPVANVGVVYSQQNADFFGRDQVRQRVERPYHGIVQALVRARIPYIPVHIDDLDKYRSDLSLLILPNVGALSEDQVTAVEAFSTNKRSLIATGATGLYNEWGERRPEFGLSQLFGISYKGSVKGRASQDESAEHSYLRLVPALGREVYGPTSGSEPVVSSPRHPVLRGFEETDIVPFGGHIYEVNPAEDTVVPLTFIPAFPIFPPETSWMREPETNVAALVLRATKDSRLAYIPADLDRRYALDNLPDHGNLLENLVRWILADDLPLRVKGRGLIDCSLYRKSNKLILHLVNLTSAGTWRSPVEEFIPIGPIEVSVRPRWGVSGNSAVQLVAERKTATARSSAWITFEIPSVTDHEVIVIE